MEVRQKIFVLNIFLNSVHMWIGGEIYVLVPPGPAGSLLPNNGENPLTRLNKLPKIYSTMVVL